MSKKSWIIVALVLLGLGLLVCALAYVFTGFSAATLSTGDSLVTNTYEVDKKFVNIEVDVDVDAVAFLPADDGECRVVCREDAKQPHIVKVEGNTLKITAPKRKGSFGIGTILSEAPEVKVYLPGSRYEKLTVDDDVGSIDLPKNFRFQSIRLTLNTGDVKCSASVEGPLYAKTDTGNIALSDLTAKELELSSDTGGIKVSSVKAAGDIRIKENTGRTTLENVRCKNLVSTGDTGSLAMTKVIASELFDLERNTGEIRFEGCDAETIYMKTDTGDITGSLLTEKVFLTETDTGEIRVPKTITGGRCELTTDTGDIKVEVK